MVELRDVRRVLLERQRQSFWRRVFPPKQRCEQPRQLDNEVIGGTESAFRQFVTEETILDFDKDDAYRVYESIWRNMDRENSLISQRITWAILLTSGFLTAETFALTRVVEIINQRPGPTGRSYDFMVWTFDACCILSLMGAAFCLFTKIGVDAAQRQTSYLKRRYFRLKDGQQPLFQGTMRLPRPFGNTDDHFSGNIAAQVFPVTMMVVWLGFAAAERYGAIIIRDLAGRVH